MIETITLSFWNGNSFWQRRVSVSFTYYGSMAKEADIQIGRNLTVLRDNVSMDLLAAKMRDLGNAWTKSTVSKVEHGERQLRLQEAVDVLKCLNMPVADNLPRLVLSDVDATYSAKVTYLEDLMDDIEGRCIELSAQAQVLSDDLAQLDAVLPDNHKPSEVIRYKSQYIAEYVRNGFLRRIEHELKSENTDELGNMPYTTHRALLDGEMRKHNSLENGENSNGESVD